MVKYIQCLHMIEYHRDIKIMLIKTYLISWKHFSVKQEKNRNASEIVYSHTPQDVPVNNRPRTLQWCRRIILELKSARHLVTL